MSETITKTRKVGGSLMVTIPKNIVEAEGLVEDQLVTITIQKVKTSGFGLLKGKIKGSFTKRDKLQWREFPQ